MGDRGNIAVIQDYNYDDQVWLYSHWGGTYMWKILQNGLSAFPGRWSDASYLTRIIHEHTVGDRGFREETGHGISCRMTDNEYPILVVDIPQKEVFIIRQKELVKGKVPNTFKPEQRWSFNDYCQLRSDPRKE